MCRICRDEEEEEEIERKRKRKREEEEEGNGWLTYHPLEVKWRERTSRSHQSSSSFFLFDADFMQVNHRQMNLHWSRKWGWNPTGLGSEWSLMQWIRTDQDEWSISCMFDASYRHKSKVRPVDQIYTGYCTLGSKIDWWTLMQELSFYQVMPKQNPQTSEWWYHLHAILVISPLCPWQVIGTCEYT